MSQQVQAVQTHPDILQAEAFRLLVSSLIRPEAHTDIHSLISRSSEALTLVVGMRRSEWQSVGKCQLQHHPPAVGTREIVGEEQVDSISLVCRQRYRLASVVHAGLHQRERNPRVGARHKLSIQLQVYTGDISRAFVDAVIRYLHVVHAVRYQVRQRLVICLSCELKRPLSELEPVVIRCYEVYASLRLYLVVQRCDRHAADGRGVSQLLEERSLIVQSRSKAQRGILIPVWYDGERCPWRHDALLVERPS